MHKKAWWTIVCGLMVSSTLLVACQPQTVEVEVVVTATPEPTEVPPPEGIADFADVPDDVLLEVCEDVKAAIQYDDAAGTVTVNLKDPAGWLLQFIAGGWTPPMDMEWMGANGGWDGDCATWVDFHDPPTEESIIFEQENGTGPFMLERWAHGEELSMVRFDDYYRTEPIWEGGPSGPAALERVVIKIVDEWGTRFAMVQTGDTDFVYVPRQFAEQIDELLLETCDYATEDCAAVSAAGTVRLFKGLPLVESRDMFFTFDVNVEGGNPYMGTTELDGSGIPPDFFNDIHIRKAFNYCFDWETQIAEVELGEGQQRKGPIINPMIGYEDDDFIYTYDLDKCAEEFQLADLDKDGIPAGEDDEGDIWTSGFYLVLTYNTGNDVRKANAEILAAGLEAVNEDFQIEILPLPWPVYLKEMIRGRMPLFIIGWHEDFHHPYNWVHPYMHPNGAFSGWQNFPEEMGAEFVEMMDEANALTDADEQHAAFNAMQEKAVAEAIDIFVSQPFGRHYERAWVQGWFFNAGQGDPVYYWISKSDDAPDPTTAVEATIGDPETLDPNWMYDSGSRQIILNTHDQLVYYNRERTDDFVPAVAESWEVSEDGLTYVFNIREGVPYHQGGTVEPQDAAYAWWRLLLQDRAGGPGWMPLEPILGVSTIEDYAIEKANEAMGM